jgi:hypothetical protein
LTNRNYRLKTDGGSFVLRIAGEGTESLGIDRAREVACSQAADAAGVGPRVIAHLPAHRALVSTFVEGRLLRSRTFGNLKSSRGLPERCGAATIIHRRRGWAASVHLRRFAATTRWP